MVGSHTRTEKMKGKLDRKRRQCVGEFCRKENHVTIEKTLWSKTF